MVIIWNEVEELRQRREDLYDRWITSDREESKSLDLLGLTSVSDTPTLTNWEPGQTLTGSPTTGTDSEE